MKQQIVEERIRALPPRCIQGFSPIPTPLPQPFDDNPKSTWKLVCRCGCETGNFLGYPLSNYVAGLEGPECFVGPLAFGCEECSTVTELLDTDQHGYHAEIGLLEGDNSGGTKYRGEGPRTAFRCPQCSNDTFIVTAGFVFWDIDELADEFDDHWEDLFNVFLCYCQCAQCGHISEPTEFGKL